MAGGGYGLDDAPCGHRWVQSGNDAVLVGIASRLIAAMSVVSTNLDFIRPRSECSGAFPHRSRGRIDKT
jgi:hypothetical protein